MKNRIRKKLMKQVVAQLEINTEKGDYSKLEIPRRKQKAVFYTVLNGAIKDSVKPWETAVLNRMNVILYKRGKLVKVK
jgi:hypothetical protein